MTELPATWQEVEIVEVLAPNENGKPFQQGWSPQCERFPALEGAWGVLKTTAIQHGEFWPHENKALPDHLEPRPQIEVKVGDVVMTCAGPRSRCGVACLVERTRPRLMLSGKMYRFRPHPDGLDPKYLAYLIQRHETQLEIDRMKTGINDSGLNLTHDRFSSLRVPLAPLREQHRIVAKIDELFSELDKAVESLTLARAQLKTYRQSLLKAAFEGELTADWRAANPDKLEPPETFLARIRAEREARYNEAVADSQTAVAEWRAGGGAGRKPAKPERPSDSVEIGNELLAELPFLPHGWAYVRLESLGDLARGKSRHRPRNDPRLFGGPYPFIQTGEVKAAGRKIVKYEQTYSEFGLEQSRLWPAGTLCITIAANIAETAFLSFESCFPDSVVGFTAFNGIVEPEFVELFIKAARVRISAYAPATAQKNINLGTLENIIVPICSSDEQFALVSEVERQFSVFDSEEAAIDAALAKISSLRQSILKKAFSGQLVPQDPTDEPAVALLARLREQAPPARTRRRKTA